MESPCQTRPFPQWVVLDIGEAVAAYHDNMSRLNHADVPLAAILKDIVSSVRFEFSYHSELVELMSIIANSSHTPDVEDYQAIVNAIYGLGKSVFAKIREHGLYDEEGAHHYKFNSLKWGRILLLERLPPTQPLY